MTMGYTFARPVYTGVDLTALLAPRSIAVVGASPNMSNFAGRTLSNLAGFAGEVWRVNPRYQEIEGEACYPNLSSLPGTPDCVVVAVGREQTATVVQECAERGVGAAILYASGYSETALADRIAQQAALSNIARERDIRILGPNCVGLINTTIRAPITFSATPEFPALAPHAIGLVSQSGALGISLSQAVAHGVSLSHVLASGNSCDVDVADLVSALVDDPACRVIACVFEGMPDPRRFLQAAERALIAQKPLVVFKLATGEEGAAAAMSHTGSLAGSLAVYRAAFEERGVVWVDRFEDLLPIASFFSKAPAPKADGVAVLATSGGASIMAADVSSRYGVQLPQPAQEAQAILKASIPEFGSARNPCDVTAQMLTDIESLWKCSRALLEDATFGALVHPAPLASPLMMERLRRFSEIARAAGKPICIVWLTQWLEGPGAAETERDPNLALFLSMESCFAAIAAWHRRDAMLRIDRASAPTPTEQLEKAASQMTGLSSGVVTERESKSILAGYGLPVLEERLAASSAAAAEAARLLFERYNCAVALKVESPDIPHKTEAGGVVLGLRDEVRVREAFEQIVASCLAYRPAAKINGVLVQPMISPGLELVIGAHRDPQFGPVVLVGIGGVYVEVLKDSVVSLAPVSLSKATHMLEQLRSAALLSGYRGAPAVDRQALANLICSVSHFICDHPRVEELDLNPVICNADGIWAADALLRIGSEARP